MISRQSPLFAFLILIFLLQGLFTTQSVALANDSNSKLLSAEVLWKMERIGSPEISPDGRWVVAPVTRYTLDDDKSHTDLWLFGSDGSVERPLTRHGSADGQPAFNADGSMIAFVTRRDDDNASQVYVLPIGEPGEARRVTDVPTGVNVIKWVGDHIYFITSVWHGKTWDEMEEEIASQRDSHVSARIWNELPFSHWDHWLDEERQAHVYRVPASELSLRMNRVSGDQALVGRDEIEAVTGTSGRELPRSTQGPGSYDVAPDESLVAFVSDTNHDDTDPKMDIYLMGPGSDEAVNITVDNDAGDSNPLFSPDGSQIAYNRQQIKGFYADTRRLVLYDVAGEEHRELTGDWDRSADGLVWAPDGSALYGAIDDAGTYRIYRIDASTGAPAPVTGQTSYSSLSVAGNGTLAALNQSFLYPNRLVLVDPSGGRVTRLDTRNDDILDKVELGTYESVTYEGYGGAEIQMWVHYPPGFDESKEYPLFLLIHGGPHSAIPDGFHFRWNAQTFASWGYVTAWHNFHGSSGFGQDFADAINPDWITKPYADTRKAAEWFADQPWIDADRMVAGGGSYGGYLSSILLGKEHPFNTLLIHAPVYNMYSQLAADFAVHTTRFGDYWEHDIYEQISPHYFAENFETPALIIHGQLDYRVPVGQAFELFRTLQHKGIESRLIYYPDENHWILKPNNSLKWYDEVRSWMARFAEPGPR
ncbi:S9 family peptidase [Balneolales bacterium ANBcel1]|nr:S9 family peptidase [Balneolales bacterium ANBcel1]